LSVDIEVVTRKKTSSKNAISAIELALSSPTDLFFFPIVQTYLILLIDFAKVTLNTAAIAASTNNV